jgi:hypothetical protein
MKKAEGRRLQGRRIKSFSIIAKVCNLNAQQLKPSEGV